MGKEDKVHYQLTERHDKGRFLVEYKLEALLLMLPVGQGNPVSGLDLCDECRDEVLRWLTDNLLQFTANHAVSEEAIILTRTDDGLESHIMNVIFHEFSHSFADLINQKYQKDKAEQKEEEREQERARRRIGGGGEEWSF